MSYAVKHREQLPAVTADEFDSLSAWLKGQFLGLDSRQPLSTTIQNTVNQSIVTAISRVGGALKSLRHYNTSQTFTAVAGNVDIPIVTVNPARSAVIHTAPLGGDNVLGVVGIVDGGSKVRYTLMSGSAPVTMTVNFWVIEHTEEGDEGPAGMLNVADLSDVETTLPANGESLLYDGSAGTWKNQSLLQRGTRADQPVASAVLSGTQYFVTDEKVTERSNGTTWQSYSTATAAAGITSISINGGIVAGQTVQANSFASGQGTPATLGVIRLNNAGGIFSRNAGNTGDIAMMVVSASDNLVIGPSSGASDIALQTNGAVHWRVTSAGNWKAEAGTQLIQWGSTSSFPALKRSGTQLQARLGDDSDYTSFRASSFGVGTSGNSSDLVNIQAAASTTSPRVKVYNQSAVQFSSTGLVLGNQEVGSGHEEWHFYAEKSASGTANGGSSFGIRRRNASQSEATSHVTIDSSGNILLNVGFSAGSGASLQGNVGIKTSVPGTALTIVATGALSWASRSRLYSDADGRITLLNAAETGFTRLMFGGTSSSYPALTRNGTALEAKLADDSAQTTFRAAKLEATGSDTAPAGFSGFHFNRRTVTGDAGGTSNPIAWDSQLTTAGGNGFAQCQAFTSVMNHDGTGTVAISAAGTILARIRSSGTITAHSTVALGFDFTSTGNITSVFRHLFLGAPTKTSTGDITGAIKVIEFANIGRATATDFDGIIMADQTQGSGVVRCIFIQQSSGTNRWNIFASGTAQNYLRGNLGIGSGKSVPAEALDIAGNQALSGFVQFTEMTAPAAGASNTARLFVEDNGSGKSRLMVQFASGAAQQIAIEP
jgi:hypothetical protein